MTENETDRQPDAPRERGGRLWKWTKRALLGFVGLVVVVLLAGVIYQFVATRLTYRNYPAPERWSQFPATRCTSTAPARPAEARP
jgi:hypothetical protein